MPRTSKQTIPTLATPPGVVKAKAGRGMKLCPWCGIPTPARAAYCKHCTKPLREQPPTMAEIQAKLEQVKALGGVTKIRERIAKIREEILAFEALGGIEKAEEVCALAEQLRSTLD